jgi:hypothetical protein
MITKGIQLCLLKKIYSMKKLTLPLTFIVFYLLACSNKNNDTAIFDYKISHYLKAKYKDYSPLNTKVVDSTSNKKHFSEIADNYEQQFNTAKEDVDRLWKTYERSKEFFGVHSTQATGDYLLWQEKKTAIAPIEQEYSTAKKNVEDATGIFNYTIVHQFKAEGKVQTDTFWSPKDSSLFKTN